MQHAVGACTGIGCAAGVEASAFGPVEHPAAQLDTLGPQAADHDAQIMAMETAQSFFDDRVLAPG